MSETESPRVAIIMGSDSDWRVMKAAATTLADLGVASLWRVVSAHRTPEDLGAFAAEAEATGIAVIIAGAGGAAHLPGMIASYTVLPVIGVPIQTTALMGLDALLSIVQMPRGIPVATVAVDGAANAALLAARILATGDPALAEQLRELRAIMAADSRKKTTKLVLE
jgi:5-(carboxyamino)imidazole ribonucleotide mutase